MMLGFSKDVADSFRRSIQRHELAQIENMARFQDLVEGADGAVTVRLRVGREVQAAARHYTDAELDEMWDRRQAARRTREAELEALRATPEYQAKLAAMEAAIAAVEPEDQPGYYDY